MDSPSPGLSIAASPLHVQHTRRQRGPTAPFNHGAAEGGPVTPGHDDEPMTTLGSGRARGRESAAGSDQRDPGPRWAGPRPTSRLSLAPWWKAPAGCAGPMSPSSTWPRAPSTGWPDPAGLATEAVDFMARNPVGARPRVAGRPGRALTAGPSRSATCPTTPSTDASNFSACPACARSWACRWCSTTSSSAPSWCGARVDPFGDRETDVLTTFAAQAAIAIRQVELLRALEPAGRSWPRKVDQLEALADVGRSVGSTLDLDEVLTTIVTHAVQRRAPTAAR